MIERLSYFSSFKCLLLLNQNTLVGEQWFIQLHVAQWWQDQTGVTKFSAVPAYYPIMLDNLASRRVAEKVGVTLEGVARNCLMAWGKAHNAALYSLIPENKAPSASTEPSLVSKLSKTFDLNSLNALGK